MSDRLTEIICRGRVGQRLGQKVCCNLFGWQGGGPSALKCPGSRLPLDFGINEGDKKGGVEGFSPAENGIRVNDQVSPRGIVHIKAISTVTAFTI